MTNARKCDWDIFEMVHEILIPAYIKDGKKKQRQKGEVKNGSVFVLTKKQKGK